MKFKIGDRVIWEYKNLIGIIRVKKYGGYGVEFDKHINGHTLEGICRDGYGWFLFEQDLKLLSINKRL